MQRSYVHDNEGYIKKYAKWLCANPNNFQFIKSAEQLLEKCFIRECSFLVDFETLGTQKKRMYLRLLRAKKNGFWICQEKTSPSPQNERSRQFNHQDLNQLDFTKSSGQRSKVKCSICRTEIEVPSNQFLVFCQVCDALFTNLQVLEGEI